MFSANTISTSSMSIPTIALLMFFSGIALRIIHHLVIHFNGASTPDNATAAPKKMKFSFLGSLLIAGTVLYAIQPDYFAPFTLDLPTAARVAGLALMTFAGAVIIWIQMLFGKSYNGTPVTRTQQNIFTSGPYKFVRHPMYTITIVFIAGLSLALDNYLIALLGAISYFIPVLIIAKREEAELISRYGEQYIAYMKTTGRFLPKL